MLRLQKLADGSVYFVRNTFTIKKLLYPAKRYRRTERNKTTKKSADGKSVVYRLCQASGHDFLLNFKQVFLQKERQLTKQIKFMQR